jgi:uncharacterized peroxidase-related enzyme
MKRLLPLSLIVFFTATVLAQSSTTSIATLEAQAKQRIKASARVELAAESALIFNGIATFDEGRVPNYLRALAGMPQAIKPYANAVRTFVYGGTIAPETKLAMALRIAQINQSPYTAAHVLRLLRASAHGAEMLSGLQSGKNLSAAEQAALRYADLLTRDANGITDAEFSQARASFNDSQLVYFSRFVEALNLPVEAWALDASVKPTLPAVAKNPLTQARIGLVSDEQLAAAIAADAARKEAAANPNGLGLGMANSQRAMMRVPDLQAAWRNHSTAVRQNSQIGRALQLHVSFAVSLANGCRYCTVHQVVGLRRLGVDPTKLMAMKKDDSTLTPRELAAVTFARKLTKQPSAITDADYAALRKEFQDYGALEVVLQTCAFAFMNRFTDTLRLPSEDEAIPTYQEVYGK